MPLSPLGGGRSNNKMFALSIEAASAEEQLQLFGTFEPTGCTSTAACRSRRISWRCGARRRLHQGPHADRFR